MAKSSSSSSHKIQLNSKRKGKAKKKYGPKDSKPKTYKGQGR
jgi:hypothetical protein